MNTASAQSRFAQKILGQTFTGLDDMYTHHKKASADIVGRYEAKRKQLARARTVKRRSTERQLSIMLLRQQNKFKLADPSLSGRQKKKELKKRNSLKWDSEVAARSQVIFQTEVTKCSHELYKEFKKFELERISTMKKILDDYLKSEIDACTLKLEALTETRRVVTLIDPDSDYSDFIERSMRCSHCADYVAPCESNKKAVSVLGIIPEGAANATKKSAGVLGIISVGCGDVSKCDR
eukprot:507528_1